MKGKKPLSGSKIYSQLNKFSHIYVERRALSYPVTQHILKAFPDSIRIVNKHYKDVFNRPRQDFYRQKDSPKIILAIKEPPFLYKGSQVCENFGNKNFYYTSVLLNCLYNCDYCYLQGLYSSANVVVFVNINDFFDAVEKQLESQFLYLCTSYDTDLLALEGLVPYTSKWIEFARYKENLCIEIRTKSANYNAIASLKPSEQVVLAWSLSPYEIVERYEKATPSLKARLTAAKAAMEDGWQVRLCFEPILKVKRWQKIYADFIEYVFSVLPHEKVFDANIGTLRMNKEYFKKIQKSRTDTDLFCLPMMCDSAGVVSYTDQEEMRKFVYDRLIRHLPKEKVYS